MSDLRQHLEDLRKVRQANPNGLWSPAGQVLVINMMHSHLDEIIALSESGSRIGKWLCAALDDPSVCQEMKNDISAWMDATQPLTARNEYHNRHEDET